MDGAIILDKAEGITSHSAVARVRRLLREPRIGHLGTLDPFASGVLVLLLGKATRLARFYAGREKSYEGTIRFGYATDTYDRSGVATSPEQQPILDPETLRLLLKEFVGQRMQQPPPVSAKQVGGVRAYKLARKGQPAQLDAVPVTIHEFEMLSLHPPCLDFRARVSAGTYIRALAHELGLRLGCGAHLERLRRTASGEFTLSDAVAFDRLEEMTREGQIPVLAPEKLLPEFPSLELSADAAASVLHGNRVQLECRGKWVKLFDPSGKLIAIGEHEASSTYHPVVVLSAPR